jgi:hypothetical protein
MSDALLLVRATCAIYVAALRDASRAFSRNPWIALLVPTYTILLHVAAVAVMPLGFAGGFLLGLVVAGCASSFLAVLEQAVNRERVRFDGLSNSFGRYLWSVVSIFFVFWIIGMLLGAIQRTNPQLHWLAVVVNAAIFILCNPVPELIYQSPQDGMQLIDEAIAFIRENALEWLIPMAIPLLPFFALDPRTGFEVMASLGPMNVLAFVMAGLASVVPEMGNLGSIVIVVLASVGVTWLMLFRGFLFRLLHRSGRRQRIFDARMRGL